ncbi:MAG TPA: Gmad2 immunoglobulin-like domain-containing protein [Candidatus Peribacteraceae bacterium]|nr:Gmad2 immunoglobulin-like domain-containing protein [Candidatus Peribacteraceae bacterium]
MTARSLAFASIALLTLAACTGNGGGQQNSSSSSSSSQTSVSSAMSWSSQPYADMIHVTSPLPGATVVSPLGVQGEAVGNWYFEASFPITIKDAHGVVLGQGPAQAIGNWMTTGFVPFAATLPFSTPTTATGTLILQNDNPSGDPSMSKEIDIPVKF